MGFTLLSLYESIPLDFFLFRHCMSVNSGRNPNLNNLKPLALGQFVEVGGTIPDKVVASVSVPVIHLDPEHSTITNSVMACSASVNPEYRGGIKSCQGASHSWLHPGRAPRFYENGIKTVEIGEARAAS